jgi:non-ribosomal peptide synthetase component E (peptide arylation enzyme)
LRSRKVEIGAKIAAEPIEEMLQRELPASAVCLFSLPNDRAEEAVHVVIEATAPIDRVRLSSLLRRALPDASRFVLHRVPNFPRSHLGKVERLALVRRLGGVGVQAGDAYASQPPSSGIRKG